MIFVKPRLFKVISNCNISGIELNGNVFITFWMQLLEGTMGFLCVNRIAALPMTWGYETILISKTCCLAGKRSVKGFI